MIINIASSHRFHLLDLARELDSLGHDVIFYSYVPSERCARFGMPKDRCRSLLWLVFPFFVLNKIVPQKSQRPIIRMRNRLMDWYLSHFQRKCDVFIGLGSVYLQSIKSSKRKWNAITILEWGSKHVIEQLSQFGTFTENSRNDVRIELEQYQNADYISIAAEHVKQSFIKHDVLANKLLVNPYGVDLSQFRATTCTNEYDIIMVGGWRFEKGADFITDVCNKYHYRFLHVGALVNMEFPVSPYMHHQPPVDQKELVNYYSKAKVFVLPSRSEGLALVQAQAIACGLPVVCSKETGGFDLRNLLSDKQWIIEMSFLDTNELRNCIERALILANSQNGKRNYAKDDVDKLSWKAYGQRYNQMINKLK